METTARFFSVEHETRQHLAFRLISYCYLFMQSFIWIWLVIPPGTARNHESSVESLELKHGLFKAFGDLDADQSHMAQISSIYRMRCGNNSRRRPE